MSPTIIFEFICWKYFSQKLSISVQNSKALFNIN